MEGFTKRLFGVPTTSPPVPSAQETAGVIQTQITLKEKQIEFWQSQANSLRDKAQHLHRTQQKQPALMALKKAKMFEARINQAMASIQTLMASAFALEGVAAAKSDTHIMRTTNAHMRAAMQGLDVVDVENVMDDMEESAMTANELGDALARTFDVGLDGMDNDTLLAELEDDSANRLEEQMRALPPAIHARPQNIVPPITSGPPLLESENHPTGGDTEELVAVRIPGRTPPSFNLPPLIPSTAPTDRPRVHELLPAHATTTPTSASNGSSSSTMTSTANESGSSLASLAQLMSD